jgi:hypothetical protein
MSSFAITLAASVIEACELQVTGFEVITSRTWAMPGHSFFS